MKTCFRCGAEKDDSDFRTGRNECRECRLKYQREYREPNYKGVPCGRKSKTFTAPDGAVMRGCSKCDLVLPISEFYPRNARGGHVPYCKLCSDIYSQLRQAAKLKYGLSVESWYEMVLNQGGKCAICEKETKLCVDHDHKTGKVRALLCSPCNTAIGSLKDSSAVAQLATNYLKRHGK